MNPAAVKWLIICAIVVVALLEIVSIAFHQGKAAGSVLSHKQYAGQLQDLQHRFDSLATVKAREHAARDSVQAHADTLTRRDSLQKVLLLKAYHQRNELQKRYDALPIYDSLSVPDISRYLSDSLP